MPASTRLLATLIPLLAVTSPGEASPAPADSLPALTEYRWKQRVLVVDTIETTATAYLDQAAALLPFWSGLMDRDLHIITRSAAPAFRVRLVGKDGEVKLDAASPINADDLFAIIDAMPMRRAEAARR